MRHIHILFIAGLISVLASCSSRQPKPEPASAATPLSEFLTRQRTISWHYLQRNISPEDPKFPGGPRPQRGIVVAGLSRKDPDYYFHWTRDSANVMRTVVAMGAAHQGGMMDDFLKLSDHLQKLKAPHGLGEPRYTVDGQVDHLPWSRPQFDGPALRALTVLAYLESLSKSEARKERLAFKVLRTDLDFIARVFEHRGFDIWEELRAENYHTRLVQMAALEKAARFLSERKLDSERPPRYQKIARFLEKSLDDHWDPTRGFLRSQLAIEATDGYTAKKTDLDSAVVVAVIEAGRESGGHSVFDDRVQGTVAVLEDLFRRSYPINQRSDLGLAYGRYQGDVYFGGNPWYLITAYYAQFYYRLARGLQQGRSFPLTERNLVFAQGLFASHSPVELTAGQVVESSDPRHSVLRAAILERAEAIMRRIQYHIPGNGQIFEQFDKNTGLPVSAPGLGWGHSSFIVACLERAKTAGAP